MDPVALRPTIGAQQRRKTARSGWGTPLMEIVRQRFTDIGKERKAITAPALPDYHQHTGPPVDVVESQPDHLPPRSPSWHIKTNMA